MVETFGNNIVGAFTGGQSVEAIYTGSVKVWPSGSIPSGSYYIKWWPKDLSGSFTIGGETRWLQDYSGYYSGPFISSTQNILINGHEVSTSVMCIDSSAFMSTGVIAIETNLTQCSIDAFAGCTSLAYVSMPYCLSVQGRAFKSCTSLRWIDLPSLKVLWPGTFDSCTNLMNISLPECELVWEETGCVDNCWNLQSIYLPICGNIQDYGLMLCGLSIVDLPNCSIIAARAFDYCTSLHTLILGYSGVCSGLGLTPSNPLYNGQGSIYVPLSLVSEYKTQYSAFSSIIYPIPHE